MATPYLGSKISLISKSEIRYEGVLYTIDTRESTIALAQVRSFGTENRQAEKYVAPREEVFEYIIFRANDIKDLIVDDPPPASITQALGDPAIIQAQSSMPSSSTTFTKPSLSTGAPSSGLNGPTSQITVGSSAIAPPTSRPVGNITNMPVFTSASAGSQSSVTSGPPAAGPAFGGVTASTMGFRSGGSSPTTGHRRSPGSDSGPPKSQTNRDDKATKNHVPNNRDPRIQNYRDNYRVSGMGGDRRQGPPQYGRRMLPGQEMPPQIARNMNFRGRGRQGPPPPPQMMPKRGPMMGRAPPQPRPQFNRAIAVQNRNPKPTTSLKIEDDFDFEKANKEFEELESKLSKVKLEDTNEKKEGEPAQPIQPVENNDEKSAKEGDEKNEDEDTFYDKTKSFFDKISCEALERSKGKVSRIDWRQERKMNAETFGLTANNFRRGGYRGRGGFQGGFSGYSRQNYNNGNRNFNQRLGGRNSYGSGSNDRRVNQPREVSW